MTQGHSRLKVENHAAVMKTPSVCFLFLMLCHISFSENGTLILDQNPRSESASQVLLRPCWYFLFPTDRKGKVRQLESRAEMAACPFM